MENSPSYILQTQLNMFLSFFSSFPVYNGYKENIEFVNHLDFGFVMNAHAIINCGKYLEFSRITFIYARVC